MYSEASKCGQAPTCTLRRTLYWESPFVMAEGTSLSGFGQTLGGSQVYKRTLKNILPLVLFVLWLVVSAALPLALEAHGTVRSPVYRRLGRLTIWHHQAMDGFALSDFCECGICHLLGLSASRDHNDSYNQTALSSPCSACRQMTTQSSLEAMATPCPEPPVG